MWCPLIPRRAPPWRPGCWPGTTWGPCGVRVWGAAPGDGDGPGHCAAVCGRRGGPRSVPGAQHHLPAARRCHPGGRRAPGRPPDVQPAGPPPARWWTRTGWWGWSPWGTWPSAAAMRWRFPGPLPTSPRTSVSPEPGPRGKTTFPPAAPVSLRLLHQGTDLTGLVPGLPGVLPEQLLEAGVRGGLRAGEIGGHGGLLLGKPPAESP